MARGRPVHVDISYSSHAAVISDESSCELDASFQSERFSTPLGFPLHDAGLVNCMAAAAKKVAAVAAARGTEGEVDLHGMTVSEAKAVVTQLWLYCGLGQQSHQGGDILLITGAGHHSGPKGPRLRPAVQRLLDDWEVEYEEGEGALLVACAGPQQQRRPGVASGRSCSDKLSLRAQPPRPVHPISRTGVLSPLTMSTRPPSSNATRTAKSLTSTALETEPRVNHAKDTARWVRAAACATSTGSSAEHAAAPHAEWTGAPPSNNLVAVTSTAPPSAPAGIPSHPAGPSFSESLAVGAHSDTDWGAIPAQHASTVADITPAVQAQRDPWRDAHLPLFSRGGAAAMGGRDDGGSQPVMPAGVVVGSGGATAAGSVNKCPGRDVPEPLLSNDAAPVAGRCGNRNIHPEVAALAEGRHGGAADAGGLEWTSALAMVGQKIWALWRGLM